MDTMHWKSSLELGLRNERYYPSGPTTPSPAYFNTLRLTTPLPDCFEYASPGHVAQFFIANPSTLIDKRSAYSLRRNSSRCNVS